MKKPNGFLATHDVLSVFGCFDDPICPDCGSIVVPHGGVVLLKKKELYCHCEWCDLSFVIMNGQVVKENKYESWT